MADDDYINWKIPRTPQLRTDLTDAVNQYSDRLRAERALAKFDGDDNLFSRQQLPDCLVTTLQIADLVNRSKKTIERLAKSGKIPAPRIRPGKARGKANQYSWCEVREPLQQALGRTDLPVRFPADMLLR